MVDRNLGRHHCAVHHVRPTALQRVVPDGSRAYVTCENGNGLEVVDARSHREIQTIKMPDHRLRPMSVVVSQDGRRMFVSTGRGGQLVVIDAASQAIVGSTEVGERPWGLALSSDGRTLYTANGPSNDVSVVDVETRAVTARLRAGESPWGVVFVP